MSDDDFLDDDEDGFGDPIHPDDRLWRHPSELRDVPPPGARSIPDTVDFAPIPHRRSVWVVVAASSLVGAAAALSVIMATGMGERVVERIVERDPVALSNPTTTVDLTIPPPETTQPGTPSMSEVAEAAAPSLAWITVLQGETWIDCAGIIVSSDGHLLTDSYPFTDHTSITVRFSDGTVEPGELVGIDPVTELAVIWVNRDNLVPATIGDPRQLKVGGPVLLLGPDEMGGTAASSAMINAVGVPARFAEGPTLYDMIQFDAPVPLELSGGPLLNTDGEIIGVTVRGGNGNRYGLATPIDSASVVAQDLIAEGRALHPWLGIEGRQNYDQPVVLEVFDGSPAQLAGLLPDDVIVAVNGEPIRSMTAFVNRVRAHRPGDELTITYLRDGEEWDCTVVLGLRD